MWFDVMRCDIALHDNIACVTLHYITYLHCATISHRITSNHITSQHYVALRYNTLHTCMNACMRAHTHKLKHTDLPTLHWIALQYIALLHITFTFSCTFTLVAHIHTPIDTYRHTYIHAYTHTYIHTYTHTYKQTYIHYILRPNDP